MKKLFKLTLSSFAILALISCGTHTASSSSEVIDTTSSSQKEESSSKSITISSNTSSIDKVSSSSEQHSSSKATSSSNAISSSSNVVSSSSSIVVSSSAIPVTYHVIFVNYDDSVLQEVDVLEGEEAHYSGQTPKRVEEDGYIYTFDGWDQPLTNVTSNMTVRATYSKKAESGWGPIIWMS